MTNLGLIDHPLTPLIVAWLEAVNRRAAYDTANHRAMELAQRNLLNAALRSPWQSIDTAPRNSDPVIVWDAPVMGEAYWDGEDETWWWANTGRGDYTADHIYPTLWHPMPAPPARDLLNATLEELKNG